MAQQKCPKCDSQNIRLFGKRYDGGQRWQCRDCRKTFSEKRPLHPVAGRLDPEKAVLALNCLIEGNSVASTERLTGITKKSLLKLLNRAASRCRRVLDRHMKGLSLENIQADEVWAYVAKKEKRVRPEDPHEYGDAYTFIAIDSETKLIPSFVVGKRDAATAYKFISTSHVERQNLTCRMAMRRLTRLTNAFSKCVRNLRAAVTLHMAVYNFVRIHSTIEVTPAMEAGVTDHLWTLEELLGLD